MLSRLSPAVARSTAIKQSLRISHNQLLRNYTTTEHTSGQHAYETEPELSARQRLSRYTITALLFSTVAGIYIFNTDRVYADSKATEQQKVNYDQVRRDIADILDKDGYDDGSLGPLFVRLAWHSSGSYSQQDGNGGSNGALIRYGPQKFWGGNAGINVAINELEVIKKKHPGISYGDLYTLCGVVAIEEMGGMSYIEGNCTLMIY